MDIPLITATYSNSELPNDDYHSDRNFVSSSGLKLLPNDVDEFIAKYMMSHKEQPRSEALKFGGGLHSAILEPDVFATEYVIEPEVNKRTNAGKDELAAFYKEVSDSGKTILTPDQMDLIRAMRNAVNQHPIASKALNGAEREKSFFHAGESINQKVRVDAFKNNIIMDIKSCESIARFQGDAFKYKYHVSEAMYRSVVTEVTGEYVEFLLIAIQKSYPFTVAVFQGHPELREIGLKQYEDAKACYINMKESNDWGQIRTINVPSWAKQNNVIIEDF